MSFDIVTVVGAVLVGLIALAVAFLVGMHRKSPWAIKPVVRLSRAVLNPKQMQTAGTKGAFASIVRHRGRTSGRAYETPVGVVEADGDLIIALPYGNQANWLRNVLASGSATIVHEDVTTRVDAPVVVPMAEVEHHFPASDRRTHRLFGVDQALRLHKVASSAAVERAGESQVGVPASM